MIKASQITPCLWFDNNAEDAANLYISVFPNSKITQISRYGKEGFEIHHRLEGSVMAVSFTLNGQPFTALNGGPIFKFTEAVSFQILCDTQEEIDHYFEKLSAGGDPKSQQCGWLKDKFGLSWQVTPKALMKMMNDPDSAKAAARATAAMLQMKKFDIATLEKAFAGK